MDINDLERIESEEGVIFSLNPVNRRIVAKGGETAVDHAVKRIVDCRDEVAALLRERHGLPDEPVVTREIVVAVPTLEQQRAAYVAWTLTKSTYFQPSPEELDRMWSVLREGDVIHFDFAKSVTVERDGRFFAVDTRGRIVEPSRYAPALLASKQNDSER